VQFAFRYAKGGGSSTKHLFKHLKSNHRINVIHESDDHKIIPAQEEIRLQIVKKETSLPKTTKIGQIILLTNKPTSVELQRAFQPQDYLSQN